MSSSRRNRMSLGPDTSSHLGDASGRINRRTSFGCKNDDDDATAVESNNDYGRESVGPQKDRRAMLEEWRRNRSGNGGSGNQLPPSSAPTTSYQAHRHHEESYSNEYSNKSFEQAEERAVARRQHTMPAAAAASLQQMDSLCGEDDTNSSGLSALDRYRLRKRGQNTISTPTSPTSHGSSENQNGNNTALSDNHDNLKVAALSTSNFLSSPADDEEHAGAGCISSSTLGTPCRMSKARSGSSSSTFSLGGAQRRVRRRTSLAPSELQPSSSSMQLASKQLPPRKSKPLLPPSYPNGSERDSDNALETASDNASHLQSDHNQKQYCPTFAETSSVVPYSNNNGIESVDVAALQSRLTVMERRNEILEREKMELSMSKAPLEARMRQMESAWVKERERLVAENDNLQSVNMENDERYREITMQNEMLVEENTRLNLAARSAAATGFKDEKDSWSERLKTNNEIKELRKLLKEKDDEIKALRLDKVSLESEVFGCQSEIQTLERNYDELEKDYRELETSKSQNSEAEIQLHELTTEYTAMTAQLNATCADLEEVKTRAKADVKAKEENWKNLESKLLFEISVLKSRVGQYAKDEVGDGTAEEDPAVLKATIEERDRLVADLQEKLLNNEQQRRALHNRVQELQGNIRVNVRIRPFLPNDGAVARQSSIDILPDGESLTIQGKHVGEAHAFKFDKVFAPSTGQDTVFDEVSEFVQSALDGYHVCLFSYGQTGSGKTHTMQGSGYGAMRGIIPRAVEQILSQAGMMKSQRWTFTVKTSFLEIYNEELRDLLVMVNSDGSTMQRDTRTAPKLAIKRNLEGKSYVEGINMVDIDVENKTNGIAQLESVMAAASRARSVATTKMNAQSSRSHSVFMLHLCGCNEESGTTVQGALNLCDLAGSERLDRSGAASNAQRLKETQAINKSLSCLGDVFTHLANGSKHVPFRNSKLTYLLQDCLSGDGKALMFVNLSPTLESSNESLCSLRFAQRVNQVELGKATKHVQYGGKGNSSVRPGNQFC